MKQTSTVDGCLLVGVSSNLGESIFSMEELVIDTQIDSQTSTPSASSKIVCEKMSCKPGDNESASKKNKQFDPRGKGGGGTALKSVCTGIFLGGGENSGLGCLACFL